MTEKRFYQKNKDDWEIFDRGKHFAYAHTGYQAQKIIRELNELVDTNNELFLEYQKLKKENERLHQKIFEERTNNALNRTEISKQQYTIQEFKEELDKW